MPLIEYPECGKIINTHGCRGAVKIDPYCDSPTVFAALPKVFLKEDGQEAHAVTRASVAGKFVVAKLEGIDSMEAAEALRGKTLYAKRTDLRLPKGVLLIAEQIGLPVFHDETGERLGTVVDIVHPGVQDIYVITAQADGSEVLVPAVPAFVREADPEKGIRLMPIEGMFTDAF